MKPCGYCSLCKWADANCHCRKPCGPCKWTSRKCYCLGDGTCGPCNWLSRFGCSCGEYRSCQPHCFADLKCKRENTKRCWVSCTYEGYEIEALTETTQRYIHGEFESDTSIKKIISKRITKKHGGKKMAITKQQKNKIISIAWNYLLDQVDVELLFAHQKY